MRRRGPVVALVTMALVVMMTLGCEPLVKKTKYDALEGAYKKATAKTAELEDQNSRLLSQVADLQTKLGDAGGKPQLDEMRAAVGSDGTVKMVRGQPTVVLEAGFLFAAGKTTVSSKGKATLTRLITLIKQKYPQAEVAVAGHADNQPINRTRSLYKDNWDIAASRAMNVVRALIAGGLRPEQVHCESYGEFRPIAPNNGKRGNPKNRRVEIMLLGVK